MPEYDIGFGPLRGPGDRGIVPQADNSLTVTGLLLSVAYVKDPKSGIQTATVTATWNAPTVGEDLGKTTKNKVTAYWVSDRQGTAFVPDETWNAERKTTVRTATFRGLVLGTILSFRVRARTGSGQYGPYATADINTSQDTTRPPRPSRPTLVGTLRGAAVRWDGGFVDSAGQPIPPPTDLAFVKVQISRAPTMANPTDGGTLSTAGSTPVTPVSSGGGPFNVYARLQAWDKSGNISDWSDIGTTSSIPVIAEDIGQEAITTEKLHAEAVNAYAIAQDAVGNYQLGPGAVNFENVINGAIQASKTNLPAIDPSSGTLAVGAVHTHNMIAEGTIIGDHILGRTIYAGLIGADEITSNEIHALTITGGKIAGTTITADNVATNTLTSGQIATGAITADELDTYAVNAKVVTGGTFRTGVPGEDRIEIIDQTVFDGYLGYNRSIRDTVRWIRGGDGALVGEIRGFMGDIGAYGLHLNSHLELGNLYSVIYQVGKRKAKNGASQASRVRAGHTFFYISGGGGSVAFDGPLSEAPSFVVATVSTGSSNNFITWRVRDFSQYGFFIDVRYVDHDPAVNGLSPGDGTYYFVSYYAEIVV